MNQKLSDHEEVRENSPTTRSARLFCLLLVLEFCTYQLRPQSSAKVLAEMTLLRSAGEAGWGQCLGLAGSLVPWDTCYPESWHATLEDHFPVPPMERAGAAGVAP